MNNLFDEIKLKDKTSRENSNLKPSICKYLDKLKKHGLLLRYDKNWGGTFGKAGRPDLEVIYKSQTWYFELKDKAILDTIQTAVIEELKLLNVPVYVIHSLDEFKTIIY